MSEQKRTKHFGDRIIQEVLQLKKAGKTNREIAETFCLRNSAAVKNLLTRYRMKVEKTTLGIPLKKKGRPSHKDETLEDKIQRLEHSVRYLQLFHQWVKRRG